jgi:hypothetical protein
VDLELKLDSRRTSAGFSIIEALVAALIFLILALGVLPLFARAISDNSSGGDSTQASNHGKGRLEELLQAPFNHQDLEVAVGALETERVDSWAQGNPFQVGDAAEGWWDGAPADKGIVLWTRTTRLRQFNVSDLDDGRLDDPQPGGTQPTFIHLKEVEVRLGNSKAGTILGGGGATFQVLKPF